MFYNKPHFTIFKANIAFNYFKWIKKKCMVAIDYHTIFFHTIEVNGYHRWFGYQHSSKYNILCSKEERKWYMFGTSGGWANNDRIFIFGWTIQEKIQTVLFFSFATGFFVSVKWPYIWQCIVFPWTCLCFLTPLHCCCYLWGQYFGVIKCISNWCKVTVACRGKPCGLHWGGTEIHLSSDIFVQKHFSAKAR